MKNRGLGASSEYDKIWFYRSIVREMITLFWVKVVSKEEITKNKDDFIVIMMLNGMLVTLNFKTNLLLI